MFFVDIDDFVYMVVINDEEQYLIWLMFWLVLVGWCEVGVSGLKVDCFVYIEMVWIDMCFVSLCCVMDGECVMCVL